MAVELITLETIKNSPMVKAVITQADKSMGTLGYTEHGFRHADLCAHISGNVMARLGFPVRQIELAAIGGYLHDIGNSISRTFHGVTGSLLAKSILEQAGVPFEEVIVVMAAIGNHEEEYGGPTSDIGAATILADKSDVHRSRVRNPDPAEFDIHDRVNYAAERSFLRVDGENRTITLEIDIDTTISPVMEYFEIFLSRMIMCRKAAKFLNCKFGLIINNTELM